MRKLLFVLLFIPLTSFSQETDSVEDNSVPITKITTTDGEIIKTKKYRVNEKNETVDIQSIDGELMRLDAKEILSIKKLIPGWNYFEWSEEGFTDYSVVEIDSMPNNKLYTQVKNWILETYNTPSEVIKAEIENKKIRIEGSKNNALSQVVFFQNYLYNIVYSIEISVRDGMYKFDPISLKYWDNGSKYVAAGYVNISAFNSENLSSYYHQKGNNKGELRFMKKFPSQIENHFNALNFSLFEYIKKNKNNSEMILDDW